MAGVPSLGVMTTARSSEVVARSADEDDGSAASLRFDGLRRGGRRSALVLEAGDVEQVEAAVAEAGADLAEEGLARGAGELADPGDDEAEDGQRRLDLERLAQLGRELVGERRPWRGGACRACRCRSCWMASS